LPATGAGDAMVACTAPPRAATPLQAGVASSGEGDSGTEQAPPAPPPPPPQPKPPHLLRGCRSDSVLLAGSGSALRRQTARHAHDIYE
jgi:hypothetical protein